MKIAFIVPCNDWSGGLKVVTDYGNRLIRRGHHVSVFYPQINRTARQQIRYATDRILLNKRTHLDRFSGPLVPVTGWNRDLFTGFDRVVVTAWETARWMYELGLPESQVVYLVQGYETWKSDADLVDSTFRYPFRKVTISTWLRDLLAEKSGDEGIPVIPNGIDPAGQPSPVSGRKYDVGMVWSSIPNKGSLAGISVLNALRQSHAGLRFVLFGSDRPTDPLPAGTDFFYRPSARSIERLYAETKVWLVNSYREGFGLPALEAMNAGCAVVSTDNLGVRDIIRSGTDGWIVEHGNPDAMIHVVSGLLTRPDVLITTSVLAQRRARQFSWERSVDQFEQVLCRAEMGGCQ